MTRKNLTIEGSGGGKGGAGASRAPREAPNTLQSRAIARVVDLISEGPIVGLVNGHKSVYYDKTPLQAADDNYNFDGAQIFERTGLPDQDPIPGFPAGETTTAVASVVEFATPVVRRISDPDVTSARVGIALAALNKLDAETGDLNGTYVSLRIEVKADADNGASTYIQRVNDVISGKTTGAYEREYLIHLDGVAPWDIRVSRTIADTDSATTADEISWNTYTEIIDSRVSYADRAVIGQAINSEQFGSSVPQRSYLADGRIISVPSNYNPTTRVYTGEWDGLFSQAWTNNPAWVLYDLLTHERYGLGDLLSEAEIDKWEFYQAAQYCDGLVDDGMGGTEPRFTFNMQIREQAEAVSVLQSIAGMFRSALIWNGELFSVMQNRPKNPVKVFTPANVIDGVFSYTGTALRARHTAAEVTWTNPDRDWEPDVMAVELPTSIERYGYNPVKFTAYGCTSPGQAYRAGLDVLLTESLETDTIAFACGLAEADLKLGDVFEVYDPMYTTASWGGRVVASTTSTVTLDREIPLVTGEVYTISIILSDGSLGVFDVVNPGTGSYDVLTLNAGTPISALNPPIAGAAWGVASASITPRTFVCMRINEKDDDTYEIAGFQYSEEKFALIDSGVFLTELTTTYSDLGNGSTVTAPPGLTLEYNTRWVGGVVQGEVTASWERSTDPYLRGYVVTYQFDNGSPTSLPETKSLSADITQRRGSRLYVWVQAVNYQGRLSAPLLKAMDMTTGLYTGRNIISNIRITGTAGLEYTGRDVFIEWDATSFISGGTARADGVDPYFKRFFVRVCNPADDSELFVFSCYKPHTTLPFERFVASVIRRDYRVYISAEDIFGNQSNEFMAVVNNPAPTVPASPWTYVVNGGGYNLKKLEFPIPDDADFKGWRVYYHYGDIEAYTEAALAPYLVYEGLGPPIWTIAGGKTTQSYVVVAGDEWGWNFAGRQTWTTTVSASEGTNIPASHTHVLANITDAGTAAGYNVGTSGATIPLLNGTNVHSGTNTFNGAIVVSADSAVPSGKVQFGRNTTQYIDFHGSASGNFIASVSPVGNPKTRLYVGVSTDSGATYDSTWVFDSADGSLKNGSNVFWHSDNDGPGSGLDADLLDGYNIGTSGAAIPLLNGVNTWSAYQSYTAGARTSTLSVGADADILLYETTGDSLGVRAGPSASYKYFQFNGGGAFYVPDGTAGAPGYAFTSDTDTGIYRSGANTLDFATAGVRRLSVSSTGTLTVQPAPSTATASIELGAGRSGNGYAYIDFVGDATYTDYGLRIIRDNTGPNATTQFLARGTGGLYITTQEAAPIYLRAGNTDRVKVNPSTTQTVEINGRLNMTTAHGTSRSVIDWGYTQSGLTISNEDNTPLNFRTTATNRVVIQATGEVDFGTSTKQSAGLVRVRRNGDAIEFGHTNTGGYGSFLGSMAGNGAPVLGFNCLTGTTNNTLKTAGLKGSVFRSDNAGGFLWQSVDTAAATDNQTPTTRLTLTAAGDLTATGNVTAYSDARLKTNVETLDALKVFDMRGVTFLKDGVRGSGVIAQEMQQVAPELVNDEHEYLSVAYGNTVGYLIEGMKYLKAELEAANARIAALEAR